MKGRALVALSLAAALLAPAGRAGAAPCAGGVLDDPVELGFGALRHRAPRRACLRTELGLGGVGSLIVQPRDFYGNVRLAGLLAGSWRARSGLELSAAVELVRWQTVISSLSAAQLGLGHTSLGAAFELARSDEAALTLAARATLPTAVGLYRSSWPFALDVGLAGTRDLAQGLEVHGWLGLAGAAAVGLVAEPRVGLSLDGGLSWRPLRPVAVVVEVEGSMGYRAALDHLAIGGGLRWGMTPALALELLAKLPLAGDERALAAAELGVRWAPGAEDAAGRGP